MMQLPIGVPGSGLPPTDFGNLGEFAYAGGITPQSPISSPATRGGFTATPISGSPYGIAQQGGASSTGSGPALGMPQVSQVQAPSMSDAVSAYGNELSTAMAPLFQKSLEQMQAAQAATGTLGSGQGAQDLQDLTSQNDATLAQSMLPLIEQGYGQQYGAATTNAGAQNSYLQQLTGLAQQSAENNAQLNLQGQEFNAGLSNEDSLANMQSQNQLQLAQMGYANGAYDSVLGQYGSLLQQGLGSLGSIAGSGVGYGLQGYLSPQTANLPYAAQSGYGQGYGAGSGSGASYSYNPLDGGYVDPSTYNPYPGGQVTITPGSGEGQDTTQPVNISGGDDGFA